MYPISSDLNSPVSACAVIVNCRSNRSRSPVNAQTEGRISSYFSDRRFEKEEDNSGDLRMKYIWDLGVVLCAYNWRPPDLPWNHRDRIIRIVMLFGRRRGVVDPMLHSN